MSDATKDLLQQGSDLMALQKYQEAKAVFQQAVESDSKDIEAYLNLGNACLALKEQDEGIAAFKKALLIDENSVLTHFSLGYAYFLKGDYASALRHFNKIEELGEANVDMYVVEASMFLDSEDYGMVIRSLNRAIALQPLNGDLRIQKAQTYVQMGKIKEAIATIRDMQELLPDEAAGYILEAQILIDTDDYEGAIEALNRSIARFPKDPTLAALKAQALNSSGKYQEALEEAMRADGLADVGAYVRQQIAFQEGIALAGLERVDESVAVLERAAREGAGAEALYLLMNECVALKRYDQALDAARRIKALDDVDPRIKGTAIFDEALSTERLGNVQEAQSLYREAVRSLRGLTIGRNGLYELYAYRALCHKALGEYDKALDLLDYLLKLDDKSAGTYALKADVLDAAGRSAEAQKARTTARTLDSTMQFGA